jgi:hypothetical protein
MNWIQVYILAILAVIHLSLLFCKSDHCAFDAGNILKSIPSKIVVIIQKMLNIIPVSLPNLQIIAHFLLIGDMIMLIGIVFKMLGSVIKYIISSILFSAIIYLIMYMVMHADDQHLFQNLI